MITLYAKDAKGQIRIWSVEELKDGILMSHGTIDGSLQEKFEAVDEGLQSRNLAEQITSRAESRINKKIDSGYCETIEEAQNKPRTNSLGFEKPMLAAKYKDCKKIDYENLWYQHKYDGNRMLVRNESGINVAYTRQGKMVNTIPEIIEFMVIPEGVTIDGEIYCHGESLQTICSWVKRRQENSLRLRYQVYDIMTEEPYESRLSTLMQMEMGDYADLVPTFKFESLLTLESNQLNVSELLHDSINQGFEGLILRQDDFGYESGKRSKSLIKVKHFDDDEFEIINMHLSKDGLPMLDLMTQSGICFKATAPGTMSKKQSHYENRKNLVGKYSHTEYAYITKDGKPFHAVSLGIIDTKDELK